VILAGESAGGVNILSLLIAPPAEGLFHKAISMSGARRSKSVAEGEASARGAILRMLINDGEAEDEPGAEAVLNEMSLSEIAAYLRSRSAAQLLTAYESSMTGMISFAYLFRDGAVIPEAGYDTLEFGDYPGKVPVILGTTKDEQRTFLLTNPALAGKDELREVVAKYGSDFWKADGVDEVAFALRTHADQPEVYVYQFLWGAVNESGATVLPPPWGPQIGAGHSIDIPFFLANDVGPLSVLNLYTEENRVSREALTEAIVAYQAAFAGTGNPNPAAARLPEWQPWTNTHDRPKCLLLDADIDGNLMMDMSTVSLTTAGVEEAMRQNVPEPLYSEARALLNR
jgi:para-nitrobenzyl esterase